MTPIRYRPEPEGPSDEQSDAPMSRGWIRYRSWRRTQREYDSCTSLRTHRNRPRRAAGRVDRQEDGRLRREGDRAAAIPEKRGCPPSDGEGVFAVFSPCVGVAGPGEREPGPRLRAIGWRPFAGRCRIWPRPRRASARCRTGRPRQRGSRWSIRQTRVYAFLVAAGRIERTRGNVGPAVLGQVRELLGLLLDVPG